MFVADLFEDTKNLVVVYPGRFQPFHKGHKAVYDHLVGKFGRDHVYIATSNKVDPPKSPFNFSDKTVFMALTGVPMDRVVESREPYRVPEITALYPAESTVLIFAVSEKDMAEDPRFRMGTKRDGSPTYFQPLPTNLRDARTLDQTGYILTVPTVDFTVLGAPMRSATEVRQQYKDVEPAVRKKIIADLFGRYSEEAQHIMDSKLVLESVNEDAAGVGVVATNKKMARDPRYSTSMTVDVGPGTLNKMMRAFNLIESLYLQDPKNPMTDSEVMIPGYGRLSILTLHKKLQNNFQELASMMSNMDPDAVRRAQYIITKSPLPVMLDSLLLAYRDLSKRRRQGGAKSRGIPPRMFSDE